ncbi:CPBP family intramembrane metalloprotease [Borreliella burgdorferi]|uniref:CPBP family intramembrane glutamic endopeptidase n=2 Tax=Borreliella burgdorferi TaxID=139 RepID=UPI000D039193|nr:CPBP family intramembrane glutamic endopeptidase [Borreliella burgdorferi]MCD2408145.1 CPBP family intramembrane metalloprotease [Borreliella burgdorferi]PRQ96590.1 CPBP family intramembrane metalloprotease [Borreliella burgdorferi]PRR27674.1 CPBP family intramembrane metalloprotease [Borreliella burgdorferi]PRR31379.1 CPBP family intramembrane metalloprotease [Borreliella burgdorferi]PRR39855.1 CPBP family intramembrane metalloprotease [Borreliella burgdorferi]
MQLLKNKYPFKRALLDLFLVYAIVYLASPFVNVNSEFWNVDENHFYFWISRSFLIIFIIYFFKLTSSYDDFRVEFFIPKFKFIFLWDSVLIFIKTILIAMIVIFLIAFLLEYLLPESVLVYYFQNNAGFNWKISSKKAFFLMAFTSFFTGAFEELFYRAFVITKFTQMGFPVVATAILSSMFFAYGHLYYGILGFLVTFILGIFFAFTYLRYKNVYYVIFIHSFYNIIVSSLLLFLN